MPTASATRYADPTGSGWRRVDRRPPGHPRRGRPSGPGRRSAQRSARNDSRSSACSRAPMSTSYRISRWSARNWTGRDHHRPWPPAAELGHQVGEVGLHPLARLVAGALPAERPAVGRSMPGGRRPRRSAVAPAGRGSRAPARRPAAAGCAPSGGRGALACSSAGTSPGSPGSAPRAPSMNAGSRCHAPAIVTSGARSPSAARAAATARA